MLAFEVALVWPDPARVDGATKRHDGPGDFPAWFAERRAAPRPTVFIKGNHEDFVWLDAQPSSEVLPGLHYLRPGTRAVESDGGPRTYTACSASIGGRACQIPARTVSFLR
ncbi:MAG: hypothetical protein HY791_25680 [Deltaproteobacteria bacterium]|nr:hypothetical protein [Deltaproteobacteria bacterium]